MKKKNSKFNTRNQEIILNSLKKGNFRCVAAKEANISSKTFHMWMKNPKPEYAAFQEEVERIEASMESYCVQKIIEAGEKDTKWLCWYLERKYKTRWNVAVHRWEFQILQKQIKQLKEIINELSQGSAPSSGFEISGFETPVHPPIDCLSDKHI